jgi:hypothetical protein
MRYCLLTLILCFTLNAQAQTKDEPRPLEPGQPVERELAGGQSQAHQLTLKTGQFMRVVAVQKGINIVVALAARRQRHLGSDFSGNFGGQESLSLMKHRSPRLPVHAFGHSSIWRRSVATSYV